MCEKGEKPLFLNKTKIKVPKKYHHMLEELSLANAEDGGYWLHVHEGYYISHEDRRIKTRRYDTAKEVLSVIRTIQPIDA